MTTTPAHPWPAATPAARPDLGEHSVLDPRRVAAQWAWRRPITDDPDALVDLTESALIDLWAPRVTAAKAAR